MMMDVDKMEKNWHFGNITSLIGIFICSFPFVIRWLLNIFSFAFSFTLFPSHIPFLVWVLPFVAHGNIYRTLRGACKSPVFTTRLGGACKLSDSVGALDFFLSVFLGVTGLFNPLSLDSTTILLRLRFFAGTFCALMASRTLVSFSFPFVFVVWAEK